jgi:hypothetical protein
MIMDKNRFGRIRLPTGHTVLHVVIFAMVGVILGIMVVDPVLLLALA